MLKTYKITANACGYDEYDSIAIVAESAERALQIAMESEDGWQPYFCEEQYPLTVEELDLSKEQIVFTSYKAG